MIWCQGTFIIWVIGLPLTMASTSQNKVDKRLSCKVCSLIMIFSTFLTDLICLSHMPPIWDAAGGLNSHLISFCNRWAFTLRSFFQLRIASRNSFSPATKLVPLSDLTFSGTPLLAQNLTKPLIKESASRLSSFSIWTARVVRHVNKQPYRLIWVRPLFTTKGPKQSTPTNENGGLPGVTLLKGKRGTA